MLYRKLHHLSSRVCRNYYVRSVARMEGNCHGSNKGRTWYGGRLLPYSILLPSTSEQSATVLGRCWNRIACRFSSEAELRRSSPIRGSFGDASSVALRLYLLGKVGGSRYLFGSLFLVYSHESKLSIELSTIPGWPAPKSPFASPDFKRLPYPHCGGMVVVSGFMTQTAEYTTQKHFWSVKGVFYCGTGGARIEL